ncbi:MAG: thioredoxin family protein [Pseudomonas sp.]
MLTNYSDNPPTREEVDALEGAVLLEFGTDWCGHCKAAQPHIVKAFTDHPELHHIKVEDGPGRKLGRSFRIKLWPTLIFLRDGKEIERLVRPTDSKPILQAMAAIHA